MCGRREFFAGWESCQDSRSGGGVEQDVPVLQVLGIRAVLQVLLKRVAALVATDGRDGRLVDGGSILSFGGHCCGCSCKSLLWWFEGEEVVVVVRNAEKAGAQVSKGGTCRLQRGGDGAEFVVGFRGP